MIETNHFDDVKLYIHVGSNILEQLLFLEQLLLRNTEIIQEANNVPLWA